MLSFAKDDFDYYNPSDESLFRILFIKAKEFEAATHPKRTRKNYMFTTKEDVGNIIANDDGAYLVTATATRQFRVNVDRAEDKAEVQGFHMDSSVEFYFKSFPGLRQLIVCITPVQKES